MSTIFIVVSFITLLMSIVDVSPIAFLKLAQNQAGNFDFSLTSDFGAMVSEGNMNLYSVDPFELDNRKVETTEEVPGLFESLTGDFYSSGSDHLELLGFSLLNFKVFEEKLEPLKEKGFRGFTPRWMLPARIQNPDKPHLRSSVLLIVVDTRKEIELGMSPYFSQ